MGTNIRTTIVFLIMSLVLTPSIYCQSHLAVPLDHPVYRILDIVSIKNTPHNMSRAKPYSRNMVLDYLKQALRNPSAFTLTEQKVLQDMLIEFQDVSKGIQNGNIFFTGLLGNVILGLKGDGETRFNVNEFDDWHMDNAIVFYLKGNISTFLSYYGSFSGTFDKVSPGAFVPYSFTKRWDSFHINFGEPRYSLDGIGSTPYFSFRLEDEICAEFFSNNLLIRLARLRRDWGFSDGNLYLSGTARPYEGFDLYGRLTHRLAFSYSVGSLGNWQKENTRFSYPEELSFQKMFTIQMIEFFPTEWLSLSIAASAIWGKRFEIGYMNPLLYPVIHQNLQGNFDNVTQSVNIVFQVPHIARFYFSFFADEMEFSDISRFFSNPRNMVAFQAGTKIPIPSGKKLPFLSFSLLTFQYTKIEPFVYAHYPEENYATFSAPVDMSYTHDGENLGYHLPPNSDEFLVKIESRLLTRFTLTLEYRLIRHGNNNKEVNGDIAIYGDVNEYFHYDQVTLYPEKLFLVDGLYDWNNIFSIEFTWELPRFNAVLTCGYDFAHTWWVENESGNIPPKNQTRNIFSISYKFFQ